MKLLLFDYGSEKAVGAQTLHAHIAKSHILCLEHHELCAAITATAFTKKQSKMC